MTKRVIGLIGPIASGKGTVVEILKKKGYIPLSLSDCIRDEIRKSGKEITRETLQLTGNALRKKYGADVLAKKIAEKIDALEKDKFIIDSIRNPQEIQFLKKKYNIYLIGITANQKRRYELYKKRHTSGDPLEWEEFRRLDNSELKNTNAHGQQVLKSLNSADAIIINEGTIEELQQKIEELLPFIPDLH